MSVDITEYDTGLKLLSEPSDTDAYDPKSMLEIIAIYGIGAHPLKTWCKTVRDGETNRVANWLTDRDMLGKEIPNARVWTFGYQSRWFGSDTIRTTVTDIVQRLLTALSQKNYPNRPILFITHCFGGLVVLKAMLLAEDPEERGSGLPYGFFKVTPAIAFFGTPFRGTDPWFRDEAPRAAAALGVQVQSDILKMLDPDNSDLCEIRNGFLARRGRHGTPKLVCFWEMRESNVGAIVGERDIYRFIIRQGSACLDASNIVPTITNHEIARDHFTMQKFGSDEEEEYRNVVHVLRELAENYPSPIRGTLTIPPLASPAAHVSGPPFHSDFWKEPPLATFQYENNIKKQKVPGLFFKYFTSSGLSPDCRKAYLLKDKLAHVYYINENEPAIAMEDKPPSKENFHGAALGNNFLAYITGRRSRVMAFTKDGKGGFLEEIIFRTEDDWQPSSVSICEKIDTLILAVGLSRTRQGKRSGQVRIYAIAINKSEDRILFEKTMEILTDSPKILNFSAQGNLLICTTVEKNQVHVWEIDTDRPALAKICKTVRPFTGSGYGDGITSASVWLSPIHQPYVLCTTSPTTEQSRSAATGGEWSFVAPASNPFPSYDLHFFHCLHHVQSTKHITIHAGAIAPQGNIIALLDRKGKLCLVPLRADKGGGMTSDVEKDPIEIKGWDLKENIFQMAAIRFDLEGKKLVGVSAKGDVMVLSFKEPAPPPISVNAPAALPWKLFTNARTFTGNLTNWVPRRIERSASCGE